MSRKCLQAPAVRLLLAASMVCLLCGAGWADKDKSWEFDIPRQKVDASLTTLAEQTGTQLLFPYDEVTSQEASPLTGRYTLNEALEILLRDTGLTGGVTESGVITVSLESAAKSKDQGDEMAGEKKGIFAGITAAVLSVFSGQNVNGQESAEAQSTGGPPALEEIIVTAQKRSERLQDVPISLAVMQGEELERSRIQNIRDLSYAVPNLSVVETGPGRQRVTMRGIGNTRGEESLIGIYLDETAVTGVPLFQIDLRVLDLARVEVLRGPQGTLYGEGSAGGTIRFITNDPRLDDLSGKAHLSVFKSEDSGWSEEVNAIVNIPVVKDVFALRVAGTHQVQSGWIDQPSVPRSNINNNDLTNVRVKGLLKVNDAFIVKATAMAYMNDGGGSNTVNLEPLADSNFVPPVQPTAETPFDNDYELFNLTATYDFGLATLVSSSAYVDMRREDVFGQNIPLDTGVLFDTLTATDLDVDILNQELRLSSQTGERFDWTVGLYYRDFESLTDFVQERLFGGVPIPNLTTRDSSKSESWAIFGDSSYALTDRLKVGVGLRYFEDDKSKLDLLTGSAQAASFDSLNPRAYMSFVATEGINAYATVAKGFRSGGFNTLGAVALGAPVAYQPEELWSYELGTKMSLFGGLLYMDAGLFYSIYKDVQAFGVPAGSTLAGAFQTNNIGEAEIKGIDLAVEWRPVDSLALGFNGNVIDGEITALNATSTTHLVGDPLDEVPEYSYGVTAEYTFTWGPSTPGFVRTAYQEQGKSTLSLRNSGLLSPVGETDTLKFLRASIGVTGERWMAELFAGNLLNEDGNANAFAFANLMRYQTRPRTIGVSIGAQF